MPKRTRQPAAAQDASRIDEQYADGAQGIQAAGPAAKPKQPVAGNPDAKPGLPRRHPAVPAQAGPADAAAPSRSGPARADETAIRSVWEPLARNRSNPPADPASAETVRYTSPSVASGPSAWQTKSQPPAQPGGQGTPGAGDEGSSDAALANGTLPGSEAAGTGPQPGAAGLPRRQSLPSLVDPVIHPRKAESIPGSTSGGGLPARPQGADGLPQRQPPSEQSATEQAAAGQAQAGQAGSAALPRRQPMTHLAAQLRRDPQPPDDQQPARSSGPTPSVWDTWRPTAAARRASQTDGSEPGDDQA